MGLVSVGQQDLKVAFSMIRLARNNSAETALIQMLLGTEPDLKELQEPMAFPIFGRGRALFALVGKGINEDVVDEASAFLVGPCSCQVKELNPGVDLLMTVDWDGMIEAQFLVEQELPPLSGFVGLTEAEDRPAALADESTEATPVEKAATGDRTATDPAAEGAANQAASRARQQMTNALLRKVLLLGLVGLVVVGGATLLILWRK